MDLKVVIGACVVILLASLSCGTCSSVTVATTVAATPAISMSATTVAQEATTVPELAASSVVTTGGADQTTAVIKTAGASTVNNAARTSKIISPSTAMEVLATSSTIPKGNYACRNFALVTKEICEKECSTGGGKVSKAYCPHCNISMWDLKKHFPNFKQENPPNVNKCTYNTTYANMTHTGDCKYCLDDKSAGSALIPGFVSSIVLFIGLMLVLA